MSLTQEAVLSFLLAGGGQVRKSELVGEFRDAVDCVDPAQRERNRELFKTFVNNLAFVKDVDGARYVVLRKAYRHLLENVQTAERNAGGNESAEEPLTGEQQRPPEGTGSSEDGEGGGPAACQETGDGENQAGEPNVIQQALQRGSYPSVSVKRMLSFHVSKQEASKECFPGRGGATVAQSKPYALPLRMAPSTTRVEVHKLKADESPESPRHRDAAGDGSSPPQPRTRPTKAPEEARDPRAPSSVPLDQFEHEWLVRCAAGHWSQVYGLLLRDSQLADKRDFMSGFTALHWAAKCGNSEMLVKIVDLSRQGGLDVDVNAKAHGGYTPLHIAALHDQQYVMAMLVNELGADVGVRDNRGKKAYHYLHDGVPESVREILGGPRPGQRSPDRAPPEREEPELFPELAKGLHSISRLFQPNAPGHKKRHKQRPRLHSLSEGPGEEQPDSSFGHRLLSEVFM